MEIIESTVEQVNSFGELGECIKADPTLVLAWQRQEIHLVEEFREVILEAGAGVTPGFFTSDEVRLVLDKMEHRYLSKPWSLSRYFPVLAAFNIFRCMRDVLVDMTPQRLIKLSDSLRKLGQHCFEADDDPLRPFAAHIQAAIHQLERGKPAQDTIAATFYLMQVYHTLSDPDALSPRLRLVLERVNKSRIVRTLSMSLQSHFNDK